VDIAECARDAQEPNDVREMASALALDSPLQGNICAGDEDWFRIEVPPNSIATVIVLGPEPDATSNVDAYAYREDGTPLGGRLVGREPNPSSIRGFDIGEESFGFFAGDRPAVYYVRVVPNNANVRAPYVISARATEWRDGNPCTAQGFALLDCTGGRRGMQTLWSFPMPSEADTYAANGYLLETVANYRFLRREMMMLFRYAVHEVMRQFPGTGPLGTMDMCQSNGITPGQDIGTPRHPGNSHDQGGNMDVAYYQTLPDNRVRVICDAMAGSQTADRYYCLPSAAMTHVVDLRRTIYFVVALARDPRFRVAGIDQVLGPIMRDEAARMRTEGLITDVELSAYNTHVVWGSGWPAHHHHLHLSMQYL